ncbi:PREDICTED: ladinin-1 [Charadrius vociferus]|uniref:ladinin-1 n=1 Tax=Charadrius vociferus TaxID=50402 RepID=UPI0005212DA2|nr:PREDICTED: ladinin-1 [Charadrius vociferus]
MVRGDIPPLKAKVFGSDLVPPSSLPERELCRGSVLGSHCTRYPQRELTHSAAILAEEESLARQRTLEDEEEQQRERRRRHRSLLSSTSTDEELPSPVKDTSPASSRRTRASMSVSEKLRQEKEQQEPGVGVSRTDEGMQPRVGQESIQADQDVAKGRGDPPGDQHTKLALERKVVVRGRLQDKEGQGVGMPRGEQKKEVGELPQRASPEVGGCRLREVKILTRQGSRSMEEKTASVVTSSLDERQPSRNPSKEVIQLSPTQDEPPEKSDPPATHVTYSSSIRRTSPRTVSFRVISRKQKEESQSPLTRSASLRIPGSNTTIGEKLEKYNSAVQRSEVVKSSLTIQKSLLLSSEGVASKRNFFEASAPSKAEPLAVRKDNMKIPGSVTSRINLWISRAQEPAKEEKSKDIRKINSLPNRDVWVKQPGDTPGDTKVDMELL